jgi:peptide/nickel transport system substrate-binding protein
MLAGLAWLAPDPASAQAKVTDKWLTVVLPTEPVDLDNCNSTRQYGGHVIKQNIVESLIGEPVEGKFQPGLAVSWEQVDDLTWRFKLRDGVVFHDGTPMDAAAVKASIDRTMTNKVLCNVTPKFFGNLKLTTTAIDPATLQIVTDTVDPILITRLAGLGISSPKTPADKLSNDTAGTGPYVLAGWQSGQEILLRRNDKYWGPQPPIEGVRYLWRSESSVRAAMVKLGEADIAIDIAYQDVNDPKLDFSYLNSETTYLRVDMTRPPLDDKRVRLALNYAFDRESVRGSILPKEILNAVQMMIPSIPGHNFELDKQVRPYDPAKAKQLLAEAKADGVPVDNEIVLIGRPAGYPNSAEVMEAFLAMYRAIGLNVKLINVEPGEYLKYNNKPFPEVRGPTLLQSTHNNNYGDPAFSVFKYLCTGPQSTMCDQHLETLATTALASKGEERVKNWQEMFRYLYEEVAPEVWMYHMTGYARVSPRIDFVPDVRINDQVRVSSISFK